MRHIVTSAYDGLLLRTYLQKELGLSHRLVTRLKQQPRGILLNGERVTVRAVLRAGDILTLATEDVPSATPTHIVPCGVMPPVLYEDEHLLVCNKSGDMPTHPSHGHFDDTLANAYAAYMLQHAGGVGVFRPVNRLDRQTSGVLLIAKHQIAAARLAEQMQKRQIQKTYLALLEGVPTPRQGRIDAAIRRAEKSVILRQVCHEDEQGAHPARTDYRVLADWQTSVGTPRSLVLAQPQTGRTHQLRVHFASIGTPIAGDGLYGHVQVPDPPTRCCLHAARLTFLHPISGQTMTVSAPLPEDLSAYLPAAVAVDPSDCTLN